MNAICRRMAVKQLQWLKNALSVERNRNFSTHSDAANDRTRAATVSNASDNQSVVAFDKLKPSRAFIVSLTDDILRKRFDRIMAELEIIEWMMPHPPQNLDDRHWSKLMTIESTEGRVSYLYGLARNVHREQLKKQRAESLSQIKKAKQDFQIEIIEKGGIGYGSGLNELIAHNPYKNKKRIRNVDGAAIWRSIRLNEKPHLVIDCQFLDNKLDGFSCKLIKQLEIMIEENASQREPFQLSIVNFSEANPNCQPIVRMIKTDYAHQTIVPYHTEKDVTDLYDREDIVYIARWAQNVVKTPLEDKVYVLCLGRDNRLPLGAARKNNCRTARIPFNEVFRLHGMHFVTFTSLARVLHLAYQTGGDWRTAISNGISRRYFIEQEENTSLNLNTQKRLRDEELTQQITQMIGDALKTQ